MPATVTEPESTPVSSQENRGTFFRQSAWLIFATFASGGLMWLLHFLNKYIPKEEYGTLGTLMTTTMLVPAIPFQMVFAQQTAAAFATGREHQLAGMIRMALWGTFGVWLAGVLAVFLLRVEIMVQFEIYDPKAIWITLLVLLTAFWTPLFLGLLQGSQNFKWLGTAMIFQGVGRFGGAALIVIALGGMAAGIMTGVLIGFLAGMLLAAWHTRHLWMMRGAPFDRGLFLRQVLPLVIGFAAYQFLLSADTIFVNAYFGKEQTSSYFAAGTLSRALVWAAAPLVGVMFPKIVHSAVKSEKTNLLGLTMICTAAVVALGALGMWLLAPWLIRLVYQPEFVEPTLRVLPWYAGAMVPLCMATVVVNNLLARYDYRAVPWMVALVAGYAFAITRYHENVVQVLQLLGIFCTLLFLVCAWFTWVSKPRGQKPNGTPPNLQPIQ